MPEERGQQSWPGAAGADETVLQNVAGQDGPVEFADFLIAAGRWKSVVVLSNVFRLVAASFSYRARQEARSVTNCAGSGAWEWL